MWYFWFSEGWYRHRWSVCLLFWLVFCELLLLWDGNSQIDFFAGTIWGTICRRHSNRFYFLIWILTMNFDMSYGLNFSVLLLCRYHFWLFIEVHDMLVFWCWCDYFCFGWCLSLISLICCFRVIIVLVGSLILCWRVRWLSGKWILCGRGSR